MHNEYLQHKSLKHITAQVDNSFHGENTPPPPPPPDFNPPQLKRD